MSLALQNRVSELEALTETLKKDITALQRDLKDLIMQRQVLLEKIMFLEKNDKVRKQVK